VRALLDAGAAVDDANDKGITPLMSAAAWGREETVRLLLSRGADAKRQTKDGKTAADIAADRGLLRLATILRDSGG
jgi:ankyrin repeat protein